MQTLRAGRKYHFLIIGRVHFCKSSAMFSRRPRVHALLSTQYSEEFRKLVFCMFKFCMIEISRECNNQELAVIPSTFGFHMCFAGRNVVLGSVSFVKCRHCHRNAFPKLCVQVDSSDCTPRGGENVPRNFSKCSHLQPSKGDDHK